MPCVRHPLLAAVVCAVLAGCGQTADTATDPAPEPSPTETTVQPTSPPTPPPSTPPSGPVAAAVADLAAALDVDPTAVEVITMEEVTWRDGSRGCAKPGDMYTQALIDGSRITLRAGGRTYEYHSGGSRPPSRCEKPTE